MPFDLQLLDENGATDVIEVEGLGEVEAIFWYMPAEYATEDVPEGWYLAVDDTPQVEFPQNGRDVPSSQGFLMNCGDGGAVVTIPSAIPTPVKE